MSKSPIETRAHAKCVGLLSRALIEVNKGEIVTLPGSNGSCEATLMMPLCGSHRASSGRVLFEGQDITDRYTPEIMRMEMAVSPEGRRVFPSLTVLKNLKMGRFFAGRDEIEVGIDLVQAPLLPSSTLDATDRSDVRWRTADACDRPHSDERSAALAVRRASAWPGR